MQRNELPHRRHCCARSGLTLIEVIVVLGIALVILAITLPAINDSRECVYKIQCESQMRNVSTAFHAYATANKGNLPSLRGPLLETDSDPANPLRPAGWPVQLLPFLEMQQLYDHLRSCTPAINADLKSTDNFASLSNISIQFYTCPGAPNADQGGALSYVVNMGYMTADIWDDPKSGDRHQVSGTYNWNNGLFDETSPEDEIVSRATGVIIQDAAGVPTRIDRIPDGQACTALLSENLTAGPWSSGSPHQIGFAVRIGGSARHIPAATESAQGLGAGSQRSSLMFSSSGIDLDVSQINGKFRRALPRPSSMHPGYVNMFFCDGSGRRISEDIDPSVYARLVSSGGSHFGQGVINGADF